MRERLLIVEDDDLNRDLLVQIFDTSYEIELATDGESAVAAAVAEMPDLILMDIGLPGWSGLDAIRAIRTKTEIAGIPIIAVSSRVMPGDREEAIEAGCDEFVAKPIDDELLIDKVGCLLDRP
jgi:CheY-like chemotaxis protein